MDLVERAQELKPKIAAKLDNIILKYGENSVVALDEKMIEINYPVTKYLEKISSFNFDLKSCNGHDIKDIIVLA